MNAESEAEILRRIIQPEAPELPALLARQILRWQFPRTDRERMESLLGKAKAGILTRKEKAEADSYERVGHFLSILKSKARTSLKARNSMA